MSSAASSSSSPVTPYQLIDKILKTNSDNPDFDLRQFVAQIDVLHAHYDIQLRKKNPIREKLGELPSALEASNFADQVSTNVTQIAKEIKDYSRNKHETNIQVLNAIGNVHWVAVGFLVVGAALTIVDTIQNNKEECLRLFKSMIDLSKIILQLQELPGLKELHDKLNESIQLIVKGAISCCSQKKRKGIPRVWRASRDKQELQQLSRDMDDMCEKLHLQISTSALQSNLVVSAPPIPTLNKDAVGIEEKIEEVIQWLDWESVSTTTAVVVYGIGGSGKTTLADAVYSSLKDKLQGWKHSRVTLIQDLEKKPKVEKLQSLILQDLTATKHDVRDFRSGQQSLKEIIEKEPIFLYIDNALYLEPLEKLLPMDVTCAKKLRLLLTARETNVSGVIESCRIKPCRLYDIGSLSIDAALQVLCRKIEREIVKESILQERPQAKQIAEKCNSCPLYLEVIGAYIHQRKNKVESYEGVLRSLESGDDFCGSDKYKFDESRVLFSYNGLNPSTKEAFLDICSFFSSWDWEEVAYIVGEEEMECLQEGALIKREDKKIKIHDLILTAGRNKSKNNRFKNVEDFSLVLKNEELVSQIKGIWLEHMNCPLLISAEELDAMSRSLRVFYVGGMIIMKGKCRKQFDKLRFLRVEYVVSNLPINILNLNHLRYLSINNSKEDVILNPSMNLPNLNVFKFSTLNGRGIDGIAEIAHLLSLKQLDLVRCNIDGISQCFPNLHNLQRLKLSWCRDLRELHESLVKLRSLQKLDLSHCSDLKQLPAGFGELVTLTELDLSYCSSLQELPCDLEKLTSLQSLNIAECSSLLCLPPGLGNLTSLTSLTIYRCESLTCLPHSLAGLTSLWGSNINFNSCSSLSELPEEICKHTMLTSISLQNCSRLKTLPNRFGELACLQRLNLTECKSLQELCLGFGKLSSLETLNLSRCDKLAELCSDFHCLVGLKYLDLKDCKSLSSLPLGFGKLSSLETLDLSRCDKLEELCSDFHCLVALKYLYLFKCDSLCNLPDRFGELGCLERLDLSGCSNLVKLSDDFHLLPSLTRLDLSKCESLGGEWMDSVGNIRSLWRLHIVRSERMIQRWMETKSQKERNLAVVTDSPEGREGERALLLEVVLSKVFDEEGLLFGADERPFHSSSLQPQTPLIFIIYSKYNYNKKWAALGKNLQQLQRNSKELQIIYVGTHFKALTSELAVRILAYTPDNSRTSTFYHKLSACFDTRSAAVFRSTDQLEENSLKCLSAWEDISYILDRVAFLRNTPGESNFELLKELLVTEKTDYLLLNENRQVKVAALKGKLILLLVTDLDETTQVCTSAVKEMYLKMQESHKYVVEVVWVPFAHNASWEEFERAAANAPWPVVPNPWLIQDLISSFVSGGIPCICVVDEKGSICKEDAMPMIERWGVEAYPFSQGREEELRKAEWEGFKFNSLSTLQFVVQNLEFLSNKAKEMMDRGVMMLICVGSPKKMMELAPHLNCALTMLEMEFQLFYVAHSDIRANDYDYDMACQKLKENESEMCSIPTLSFSDIDKFWRRVEYLQKELNGMGADERIVKVRRMVLGLASADWNYRFYESGIRIVVVDGNGEMVSGRGMEMVELLCDGEEDSKEKLVEDIKNRGVEISVESRWRDGIIHPQHYPQHPLLLLLARNDIRCSLCGGPCSIYHQCNVCEKYAVCWKC